MSYRKEDHFRHFISGMDQKMQAELSLMFTHNRMVDEINRRREMEMLKQEITEEVMSRISIYIDKEAIEQLRDMLNSLGK